MGKPFFEIDADAKATQEAPKEEKPKKEETI